ncbi:antibiotic biosynthesis monooxygenase [Streptomyces sp. NPDC048506]|uniref:antibiotic biosynthesis monooxygenase n=1 Tax=Streptomyces sp. NPDC048506 TaxID=3155028 RepID=UPI00343A19B2
MARRRTLPDLTRPDAGTTLVSEWHVGTAARQRAAAEVLLGEWDELSARLRPTAFVQLSCFASEDGRVLLSLAQWTGDEAHLAFVREHRAALVSRVDQQVPGIERPGLVRYRVLHNIVPETAAQTADHIALLRAETRSPDRARHWADDTAARLHDTAARVHGNTARLHDTAGAGSGAVHVLLSTDGTNVLLYAPLAPVTHPSSGNPIFPTVNGSFPAPDGAEVHIHPPQRYHLLGSVQGVRS